MAGEDCACLGVEKRRPGVAVSWEGGMECVHSVVLYALRDPSSVICLAISPFLSLFAVSPPLSLIVGVVVRFP